MPHRSMLRVPCVAFNALHNVGVDAARHKSEDHQVYIHC